jgi:hypothetical protein
MGADGEGLDGGVLIFEVGEPSVECFNGAVGISPDHDLIFERKLVGVPDLVARVSDPTNIDGMIMMPAAGGNEQ